MLWIVVQLCLTLCDPMDCSMPSSSVLHCLQEFAQIHDHWISRWHYPIISSSVIPFSSRLQSFPASGPFPVSQFFASGGQSIGVSASASVLPMNIQDWYSLGLTGLILQSKGLSRVFSNTAVQKLLPYRLPLTLSRVPCAMYGRSLLVIHLKYSSLHVDHKLPAYPFPHPSPKHSPS